MSIENKQRKIMIKFYTEMLHYCFVLSPSLPRSPEKYTSELGIVYSFKLPPIALLPMQYLSIETNCKNKEGDYDGAFVSVNLRNQIGIVLHMDFCWH